MTSMLLDFVSSSMGLQELRRKAAVRSNKILKSFFRFLMAAPLI
jgi:hypothetical protein